jgi:ubiquinone/menaquinone biosynthesis C-methylase UbiE
MIADYSLETGAGYAAPIFSENDRDNEMSTDRNFYDNAYGNFADDVLSVVRIETFGVDLGQNSWLTADEYDRFCGLLQIAAQSRVLETASGSGGPAVYMAEKYGCTVTGIDINADGIRNADSLASDRGLANASFQKVDVSGRLPFGDEAFDAVICIDAANHFLDRKHVLREWARILGSGGRLLFTDPVVITGPVSNHELARRSSIGDFIFMPAETTERFITDAGLRLIDRIDVTTNIMETSGRWLRSREKYREPLLEIESAADFEQTQAFLAAVNKLTTERRLSRFAFLAEK